MTPQVEAPTGCPKALNAGNPACYKCGVVKDTRQDCPYCGIERRCTIRKCHRRTKSDIGLCCIHEVYWHYFLRGWVNANGKEIRCGRHARQWFTAYRAFKAEADAGSLAEIVEALDHTKGQISRN